MNMSNKRKAFVIASLAVGIGLLAWVGFVRQPADEQVAGTIGAASRYRAGQITDKDVVLGDTETQQFMQSDAFHKLVTDPEARRILASPGFQAFRENPGFAMAVAELMKRPEFAQKPELLRTVGELAARPEFAQKPELLSSVAAIAARPEFAQKPELVRAAAQIAARPEFAQKPELMSAVA